MAALPLNFICFQNWRGKNLASVKLKVCFKIHLDKAGAVHAWSALTQSGLKMENPVFWHMIVVEDSLSHSKYSLPKRQLPSGRTRALRVFGASKSELAYAFISLLNQCFFFQPPPPQPYLSLSPPHIQPRTEEKLLFHFFFFLVHYVSRPVPSENSTIRH